MVSFFDPKNWTDEKNISKQRYYQLCQPFPSKITSRKVWLDQSSQQNCVKFGTVLLESEQGSDHCIENNAISTDNSEDSDIFHNSDHDPFEAESEEDDEHKDKPFE